MNNKTKTDTLEEKQAVDRIMQSADGQLLLRYLGKCCLATLGQRCRDHYEYAYNEGARSILLALMQFTAKDATFFINDMVLKQEGKL